MLLTGLSPVFISALRTQLLQNSWGAVKDNSGKAGKRLATSELTCYRYQ